MPLPLIPLAVGGAILVLLATRGPKRGELVEPAAHRDPLPDLEVIAEFHPATMAQIATECLGSARLPAGDPSEWTGAELEAAEFELAACIGDESYPEINWPALTGDHPSIALVWQKLLVLASEVIAESAQPVVEPERPLPPLPTRGE